MSAATRQVEAAIDAIERGDYDVAITLAGAAEGMLPELAHQPLFTMMRDNPKVPPELSKKVWISTLNAERDWLEHPTVVLGEEINLELGDGVFMLLRAFARLPSWTPRMYEFKAWSSEQGYLSAPSDH